MLQTTGRRVGLLRIVAQLTLAFCCLCRAETLPKRPTDAARIIAQSGVTGGLVVHVGCEDPQLLTDLRQLGPYYGNGLATDVRDLPQHRATLRAAGLLGPVSVDAWKSGPLPYVDNLVNLLIWDVAEPPDGQEILRVLAPEGVAILPGRSPIRKPRPDEVDDWSHYLHDATGNPVAHDSIVGPPEHLQWISEPKWSRHHDRMASMSALVSNQGRLFYIMDEGSRVSIQLPPKWKLIARDAFNGMLLWKQELPTWFPHLFPLKSGPTQLARRLVAANQRVYVTLGIHAPVSILDATNGKLLHQLDDTVGTEEILVRGDTLFALASPSARLPHPFKPSTNAEQRTRQQRDFGWDRQPRQIHCLNADTGAPRWMVEATVAPLTMAADDMRLYYFDGTHVSCLDRESGKLHWQTEASAGKRMGTTNFGARLLVFGEVVLFAGGDRKMQAMDAASGKLLWNSEHARGGYMSPEDLLVASGLVWSAPLTRTPDSGVFTGRDPLTGEIVKRFRPDVETYWFHHRCYMAKATNRFLLPSRTGIEFVDVQRESWKFHHWVRGGCLYGIMPCNGLVYAPPHDCACYPESKLFGFNALAPRRDSRPPSTLQLPEHGPAAETLLANRPSVSDQDWPTYRHDAARSGRASTALPGDQLTQVWSTKVASRLGSLTAVGNLVFAPAIDEHAVVALNLSDGTIAWTFDTGARVDSPPTYWHGRLLFGSADGWVYSVRAHDGVLDWKRRIAPHHQRLVARDQLESVWPIHGSVLVQDDTVYCIAGRSIFLDGGLRLVALDAATGELIHQAFMTDQDDQSNTAIQDHIKVLNMPTGLPDVLSSDGKFLYMRSQVLSKELRRQNLAPHSGQPEAQGARQSGETAHLFSPTGFLDGSWFHRSYWIFGRSFAGGHAGYYQAGRFTPSGRLVVVDNDRIYGYRRKSQYFQWTTPLEHQLFAAPKKPSNDQGPAPGPSTVFFAGRPELNPAGRPLTISAWVKTEKPDGCILARGGSKSGYALIVRGGHLQFVLRRNSIIHVASDPKRLGKKWRHIAATLAQDGELQLLVDGEQVARIQTPGPLTTEPREGLTIGADARSTVGSYRASFAFRGRLDELQIWHRALSAESIGLLAAGKRPSNADEQLVLNCPFDNGTPRDASRHNRRPTVKGTQSMPGRIGKGLRFRGAAAVAARRIRPLWSTDVPLFTQGMVLCGDRLLVAGPKDVMDEEDTFKRLSVGDTSVDAVLRDQDQALSPTARALLVTYSTADGKEKARVELPSAPVWDGIIVASHHVLLATQTGHVIALRARD